MHRQTIMSYRTSRRATPLLEHGSGAIRRNGGGTPFYGAAWEGATEMAVMVTRASDATEDLAAMSGAAVLGSLTIPGRPEHVRQARAFTARTLGELGAAAGALAETAVLLTS